MFSINTILLPDPELGDTEASHLSVRVRKTRSGKFHTTMQDPTGTTRTYTFNNVTALIVADLKAAIAADLDLIYDIIDHRGQVFTANILDFQSSNQSRYEERQVILTLRTL